ncbi:MAG: glycosyl hydrolase [Chloroflexota bacterium]
MSQTYDLTNLLRWRCIGPFRGGRVVTVAGDPNDIGTFYFGACAGGVWKTTDAGTYWHNVSDGYFNTSPVGALAVAHSDPNVIYAGTGETTIRIDVSTGDGVYKSTDGGESWQHMGLNDSRAISKIRVHSNNPDLVYVAALGHPFGPNEERGVFRSQDGGVTWDKILYQSDKAGAIDLTMDPRNPRILYATMWEAYRSFSNIVSGGPGSRIYKSTDGGDSWTDISTNEGLPKGTLGKMAIAVSPAKTGRVWALIEAEEHGLYRSDNGGKSWERLNEERKLVERAWYFTHITADSTDPDTVYVNNLGFYKSTDGGKTFATIDTPHGDNHGLWIDPVNNRRMVQGNDGGANVSLNGGESWSTIFNQPTAQFYRIDVDNQYPYRVYGTQQDNTSISVPSASPNHVIPWADCYVAGTGESGYIAVHPEDPNIVFVGAIGSSPGGGNALQMYDHRSGQIRLVTVWPESNEGYGASADKYRFAWTYPIVFSPHDSNVLYAGGNHVFKTTDRGNSWQPISPDLTVADPETLKPSGGPINWDAIGAEHYATVFAFIESQHKAGVLWAGSDDGLLHISKNGGASWDNVTPAEMPAFTQIHCIEQSPHDPATVYVAGTRYKLDDYQPLLFKSNDYGQSWQKIINGIGVTDFTRVIREDPARRGLLYAGTEVGLYISFDDGANWQKFQLNLPVTPIYDMKIKENDLVVGTHGRSFWVLDDLTPLHQISDETMAADSHLFAPRTTIRQWPYWFEEWVGGNPGKNYGVTFGHVTTYTENKSAEGAKTRHFLDAGENPPNGVIVTYYLKEKSEGKVSLRFLTAAGKEIVAFEPKPAEKPKDKKDAKPLYMPTNAGMNRFIWNMRWATGTKVEGLKAGGSTPRGPRVPPGDYQVELSVGDVVQTAVFSITKSPALSSSDADLDAKFKLLMEIRGVMSQANEAVNRNLNLAGQLDGWVKRVAGHEKESEITDAANALKEKLSTNLNTLIIPDLRSEWDVMNKKIRLIGKLASLVPVVEGADYAPTTQSYEFFAEISGKINTQLEEFDNIMLSDVAAFNALIAENEISALV